ncbi:hypothetical protein ABQX22_14415 [Xanthomonas sp. WHRI 1810A]|uniref:DUF883 family protein n=1 Tax=Xanthomonas sp. WHRI 1810A TaxID=3161565 RepID=UPI0032E8A49F
MAKDITKQLTDDLYDKTRSELSTFLNETDALLQAGDAINEDRTSQARQRLNAFLDSAASTVTSYDTAVDRSSQALSSAKAYVKANPWQAVAAAAGIGLLVSIVLNRRDH